MEKTTIDFSCPRCGCADTKRESFSIIDHTGRFFLVAAVLAAMRIPLGPVPFLVCGVVVIIFCILKFLHAKSGTWAMQCSRCGEDFIVDAPDKEEAVARFKRGIAILIAVILSVLVASLFHAAKGTKAGHVLYCLASVFLFGGGALVLFLEGRRETSKWGKARYYAFGVLVALFAAVAVFGNLVAAGAFGE